MIQTLKRVARSILPDGVRQWISQKTVDRRIRELSKLSTAETFNTIYRKRYWQQGNSLSGPGSEGKLATDYVAIVADYIRDNAVASVVDGGCGDFSVGAQLAPLVGRYIAGDISSFIIEANRTKYRHLAQVQFRELNLIKDPIPDCDLLLIRQVVQHLTNAQIQSVLDNIDASNVKRVLITEDCSTRADEVGYNLDMSSPSVATRVLQGSGVDISKPPFSRDAKVIAEIKPAASGSTVPDGYLRIYEMTFGRG